MNILNYNGYDIEQRPDGYVNGTAMCIANDVNLTDWLRLTTTNKYVSALSLETRIPSRSLYVKVSEGFPAKTAYWLHPLLALNLGRWINDEFAIWCDKHIKNLIETGSTQLEEVKSKTNLTFDPSSLTKLEILRMAVESEENYLAEQEKTKYLTGVLQEQAPLVKLAETLTTKEVDTVSIGDLARSYGIGRTTFFNLLRDIKFIQQKPSRQPYQHHIDAGRAEVYRKERIQQPGIFDNVTVLTTKGQEYIARKLAELDHFQQTEVAMEAVVALQG